MPPRVYNIAFTVPAGTPKANPISAPWVTEDNTIVDIELEVPPGHNGQTGLRVMKGDVQLLPWSAGTFMVVNNYNRVFPVNAYLPTSDVTLQGYNTGQYPHTFFLRMTMEDHDQQGSSPQGSPSQALPAESVTTAADPLSPDGLLGPDAAAAVTDGTLTADDLAPVNAADLSLPPSPEPAGL